MPPSNLDDGTLILKQIAAAAFCQLALRLRSFREGAGWYAMRE